VRFTSKVLEIADGDTVTVFDVRKIPHWLANFNPENSPS